MLVVAGALAWHYQSAIIGRATGWYLARVAASEAKTGDLTRRRQVVAQFNRMLLMPPPPDALVPELFDFVTLLSSRIATGQVSLNWAAYLYTAYQRDLLEQRPTGTPRRSLDEVRAALDRQIAFFSIQKRPDQAGITVGDLVGAGDDVITLDEIEAAERKGQEIDPRTGKPRAAPDAAAPPR